MPSLITSPTASDNRVTPPIALFSSAATAEDKRCRSSHAPVIRSRRCLSINSCINSAIGWVTWNRVGIAGTAVWRNFAHANVGELFVCVASSLNERSKSKLFGKLLLVKRVSTVDDLLQGCRVFITIRCPWSMSRSIEARCQGWRLAWLLSVKK